ncbi:MAG: DUF4956 domain-containing protein [Gemmatimonadota bacterium]|nr:DUF4956 domain-containing protein [Gemmatimonadota bacterium]
MAKALTRVILYYALLFTVGALALRVLPTGGHFVETVDLLGGSGSPLQAAKGADRIQLGEVDLAFTVAAAMLSAVLLSLPVAWIYVLTRAKRGFDQSVVHLLIVLPLVVSGIVVLVQYSLALAFSLAGIVAAVRFRNTLDDSKDAVYVFLATAIGLSAAVNVPVAATISVVFNIVMFTLWYLDFAHSATELEGKIAEKRLRRAKQLARTGTFVARIDDEVFRNMSREQLEGVAERAWRRAQGSGSERSENPSETRLRIRTGNVASLRETLEPRLGSHVKSWRFAGAIPGSDGVETVEYWIQVKKSGAPDELLTLVRAAGAPHITDAEVA